MIIHLDSDNPKPIEQKVQELILQKLFIKVDDEKIFINKEEFIASILKDIIIIAQAEFDMEEALKVALKSQPAYKEHSEIKMNELNEVAEEFAVEIEAYSHCLYSININNLHNNIS